MNLTRLGAIAGALVLAVAGAVTWQSLTKENGPSVEVGTALVQVAVPELPPAAREGQAVFRANCATCHGDIAEGREGLGPPLVHKIYEPGHHSDGSFYLAAAQGVRAHHWPFGDMPPVSDVSQDDVSKIVAYVRTLQRANGIF